MSGPGRSLAALVRHLAEAKHTLGYRLARAGLSAPALEATVATVAIAQEELGHARLLYASESRLRDGGGDRDPGLALDIQTTVPAPELVPPLEEWLDVLATLATLDTALGLWLHALARGDASWLAIRARRMLEEEEAHRVYLDGWLRLVAPVPALAAPLVRAVDASHERYGAWMLRVAGAATASPGADGAMPLVADLDDAVATVLRRCGFHRKGALDAQAVR